MLPVWRTSSPAFSIGGGFLISTDWFFQIHCGLIQHWIWKGQPLPYTVSYVGLSRSLKLKSLGRCFYGGLTCNWELSLADEWQESVSRFRQSWKASSTSRYMMILTGASGRCAECEMIMLSV